MASQRCAGSWTEDFLTAIRFGACRAGLAVPRFASGFLDSVWSAVSFAERRCSDPDAKQFEIRVGLTILGRFFLLILFGARGQACVVSGAQATSAWPMTNNLIRYR